MKIKTCVFCWIVSILFCFVFICFGLFVLVCFGLFYFVLVCFILLLCGLFCFIMCFAIWWRKIMLCDRQFQFSAKFGHWLFFGLLTFTFEIHDF